MYRRIFLGLLFICLSSMAFSQSRNHFFYKIYADGGLASDKTTVTLEDYMGFVWVGTKDGLNRVKDYGGFDTYKFDRKDSTTISDNHITVLFEDSEQNLWVGTKDGLNVYDRGLNRFMRIPIRHEKERNGTIHIRHISQDSAGDFWFICNDHVVRVSSETFKEELVLDAMDEEGAILQPTDIAFFKSEMLISTLKGVYKLAGKKLVKTDLAENDPVTTMLALGNELWMGTANKGVIAYNDTRKKSRVFDQSNRQTPLTSNHVNHLCSVDDGSVWVATMDGITIINLKTEESQLIRYDFESGYSLSDKTLRHIYQDRQGVIWITTPNSGISYYHLADNTFSYFGQTAKEGTKNDLMDYNIFSLFHNGGSEVWLGSRKGLSKFSPKSNSFDHYPLPESLSANVTGIMAIDDCGDDNLWLGTNNGLLSWRVKTETYERVLPNVLNNMQINAVMVDENDDAWLGTENQGVKLYSTISKIVRNITVKVDGITLDYVPAIQTINQMSNGDVLVGSDRGLFLFKDGVLEKVSISNQSGLEPGDIPVTAIYESDNHGIMIATQQDGLLLLDNQMRLVKTYNKDAGLSSDDIRSIVEDDEGIVWLSTNAGLTKLELDLKDSTKTVIKNYDINDGLQSNHFSERAGVKNDEGKIFMAGFSGLSLFHPDDVIEFKILQNLTLTSLSVNGEKVKPGVEGSPLAQDISLIDELVLNCEQNDFTISFGALDNVRPGGVEYRYKLVGYNDNWTTKKLEGKAVFQNIPGGIDYDFVVQSKGRFSDWSEERHLTVRIDPHFYETFLFKVLIGLAVIGVVVLLFWIRNRRVVLKRRALEALVEERSVNLTKEIGERKRAEEKLQIALSQAENANDVKSRFLANMSHEIRTPLNGIMGLAQLSLETGSEDEQEDILNTLVTSANSLKVIVDDILDIAKIEAGTMDFASEVFSVKDLLEEVISSFRTLVDEKGLYLKKWVLPTIPGLVLGDVDRVRQVLVNLISNAIKFTHQGGVTILAEGLDQGGDEIEIWFTVTDTGIGMPETQLNRIFESFTQVDSGDTRAYGGTGLGLSICKELVEKMGGEIWAESDEDSGSIFRFYIEADEVFEEDYSETKKGFIVELPEESKHSNLKKVLLVEDNPTNQKVASKMLERNSIEVSCANNGLEGLQMIKESEFDLVLMDLQMPEMDGYGATKGIRALDSNKSKVPIIALTAAAMVGEREKCLEAGMDDYLSKPVDYNLLIKTVNKYLHSDLEEQKV